jgi:hypothetical protein
MQCRATFEVVVLGGLVIGPTEQGETVSPWYQRCSKLDTYICFPPKINRCWTGGIPSFSSTRSFIRDTWHREISTFEWNTQGSESALFEYLVVRLDVQFNLLSGKCTDPERWRSPVSRCNRMYAESVFSLDQHLEDAMLYLITWKFFGGLRYS